MILTLEIFEQGRGINGFFKKSQIRNLGVIWEKGWKHKIINQDFPEHKIKQFIETRNTKAKFKGNDQLNLF